MFTNDSSIVFLNIPRLQLIFKYFPSVEKFVYFLLFFMTAKSDDKTKRDKISTNLKKNFIFVVLTFVDVGSFTR